MLSTRFSRTVSTACSPGKGRPKVKGNSVFGGRLRPQCSLGLKDVYTLQRDRSQCPKVKGNSVFGLACTRIGSLLHRWGGTEDSQFRWVLFHHGDTSRLVDLCQRCSSHRMNGFGNTKTFLLVRRLPLMAPVGSVGCDICSHLIQLDQ